MRQLEKLINEVCFHLAQTERNGIKIDLKVLDEIEKEYRDEYKVLKRKLERYVKYLMGDYPINLESPADLSILIYSRRIKNKRKWMETFNLGTIMQYGRRVPKRRHYFKKRIFDKLVNDMTELLPKTKAIRCTGCNGKGYIQKNKKDGTPYKKHTKCKECGTKGVKLIPVLPKYVAGLHVIPKGVNDLSATGFITNKDKLEELANHVTGEAKTVLQTLVRYNKVKHYLSHFVDGIRNNVEGDGLLHTEYMQCVTATGRLSSRNPNFHNQPRGATFPVRRCIISRWKGGKITEGDYNQLEFREAAELSGCQVAKGVILDGEDIHQTTSDILTKAGQQTDRYHAKSHTFKPLYGGTQGTKAEKTYYQSFLKRFTGISAWHEILCEQAVKRKFIVLPSGRVYRFPYAKRFPNGGVSGRTKIVNYPVQGFATADIVPCAFVAVARAIKERNLRSLLINEVHDSIVVDTYPGEEEVVAQLLYDTMVNIDKDIKERFNYQLTIPLAVEVKQGPNWLDMEEIK